MSRVGVRALKQNASAVVAEAAAGGEVTITDRGRPVAQLVPLATSRLDELVSAGRARPAKRPLDELPAPIRRRHGRAPLWGAPEQMQQARAVLDSVVLVTVSTALFERAGDLEPDLLRSLDTLHLAGALDLGDDLDGIISYDDRLAAAAMAHGIVVLAPS